ncbi:MAG: bifunctional UDP-N-acetylglucosamine diphosphorylase/glucosamine-1-phosphate N-acetyltransferase GlmU [Parvularculaceae bacterium]|nr:bifunctional UDP-N-acetylglucosamine diphosphorylase/glucosamine-1-phosphate N-acetyltransferase GlmU [Parvularculaceae bacterium]
MNNSPVAAIILAAGHGTRMKSATPKVLHKIAGRSMLAHVMAAAAELTPARVAVVIGDHSPQVGEAAIAAHAGATVAVQAPPQGTGDAVKQAMPALEGFDGVVLVLYADTPLVEADTLRALAAKVEAGVAVSVMGFRPDDPGAYGRLKLGADGALEAIVEARDAAPQELEIDLVNSGVMAIDAGFLARALPQLTNDNAKKEYYLTDIVAIARAEGRACAVIESDEEEVVGVNSRLELAIAEEIYQDRRRYLAMENGVTLIDPSTVYFSWDSDIAADVTVEPGVFFGPGVKIGAGAVIKAWSHLEGANVGANCQVGPFARLRPGANLGDAAKVGNFVEIKKAQIGADAKVSHLTYIGDAKIGARANIGAGTITCNYDGYDKFVTEIGDDAFIGSNTALVAPVSVGAGAYVGSGSVITKNVDPDALAVARGRQASIPGWAAKFRKSHKGEK